jgi:aspartyl protease family protein
MRWFAFSLLLLGLALDAAAQVRVLALFPGKAMLEVDGQRKVLAAGQTLGGVKLLKANTSQALVSIDGRQQTLQLGSTVSARYAPAQRSEIRLLGTGDSFFINGLINGQPVRMLVDTGATTVAISERQARALGLRYVIEGSPTRIGTASGVATGYNMRLRSLKLGDRQFNDVDAVVVEGDSPAHVLLGMNVLSRFDIQHDGNLMVLRSKR